MTISVYLSNDISDILSCYGSIDDVVDKILTMGSQGMLDVMDKPPAPEKRGGKYYHVNIKNSDYITLVETYGTKSSRISLRRLLYWFVENEMYNELGWEPCDYFVEYKNNKAYKAITELKQALFNIKSYLPEEYNHDVDRFKNLLNRIEEDIWHVQ